MPSLQVSPQSSGLSETPENPDELSRRAVPTSVAISSMQLPDDIPLSFGRCGFYKLWHGGVLLGVKVFMCRNYRESDLVAWLGDAFCGLNRARHARSYHPLEDSHCSDTVDDHNRMATRRSAGSAMV